MLTVKKLNIYEKYHGNWEGLFRFGKKKDQSILTEKDWPEIETLLSQLYLVQKNLASKEFEEKLHQSLKEKTDSAETKERLLSFVNKDWYP